MSNELENKIKELQAELSKLNAEKNEKKHNIMGGSATKYSVYKLPKTTVALRRRCAI